MNRLIMRVILLALLVLGFVGSAYAGAGKAYIPQWYNADTWRTDLHLTNITDEDILVTIKLVNFDGELYQENASSDSSGLIRIGSTPTSYYDYKEYAPGEEYKTLSFWLKPQNTAQVLVISDSSVRKFGWGTVEWSGCANGYGMVGFEMSYGSPGLTTAVQFPLNGGNPF